MLTLKMGVILIHSTWTTLNNFKSPMPRMFLPSLRGRRGPKYFLETSLQHSDFSFPLHTPELIIKMTLTSQIQQLHCLNCLLWLMANDHITIGLETLHCKVISKANSRNILSIFMKQSRLLQTVIQTLNENFSACKLWDLLASIQVQLYFQIHEIRNLFFIHSHLDRISNRCWEFPS